MVSGLGEKCRDILGRAERFPLAAAFGLYTVAFLALAWPWLSGAVEIPYDAASQFYPQFAFLARSFATGQSPFWTPNIFAGWPQIADPQSLIFSPLHVIAALLVPNPSPRLFDALVFVLLYAGGAGVILFFRDRGWHVGGALVAALAFSFGGSAASRIQHVGQVESLVFLPLALWMLARALERSSWRAGAGAGVFAAMIVLGRDQVSLIAVYVLVGFVLWHWACGAGPAGADRREREAAAGGRRCRRFDRDRSGHADGVARGPFEPAGDRLRLRRRRLAASGQSADAGVRRSVRRVRLQPRALGTAGLCLARRVRADRSLRRAEHRPDLCGRARRRRGARLRRGARTALDARDPLLHRGDGADAALCARQIHAGLSSDLRLRSGRDAVTAGRPMRPSCSARCWRSSPAISCIAG